MKYGESGESFNLDGSVVMVDTAFLLSTIMAIMVLLRERLPIAENEDSADIFDIVEFLASRIYETITQNQSESTGTPTGTPQG